MLALAILSASASDCPKAPAICDLAQGLAASAGVIAEHSEPPENDRPLLTDLQTALWPCYLRHLGEADIEGFVDAVVVANADGEVVAWTAAGDGFSGFEECTSGALRTVDTSPQPQWMHTRVFLGHTTEMSLHPANGITRGDEGRDINTMLKGAHAWGDALEACVTGKGVTKPFEVSFSAKVRQNGSLTQVHQVQAAPETSIDDCLLQTLSAQTTASTMTSARVGILLRFFRPQVEPE
jgi:hypothetical protein